MPETSDNGAVVDPRLARRRMKSLAERGDAMASYTYASFVAEGVGGRPSLAKSIKWFKRAAALGIPAACVHMADWHAENGQIPQAKKWIKRAGNEPRALFLWVELHSRSRSVRATVAAKNGLKLLGGMRDQMDAPSLARLILLEEEYAKRKSDPIWSPGNASERVRRSLIAD